MSLEGVPAEATGVIVVDLAVLAANWRALAARVAPATCAAVVKADAYGLGASRVVPALAAAGCTTFFVATTSEAREVRALAPGAELYVLDGLMPHAGPELVALAAEPVLSSLPEVREWAAEARKLRRRLPAAVHIDTGLNRLGIGEDGLTELARGADAFDAIDLTLVMSHLASADDPDAAKNTAQLAAFNRRRALLPAARASLAASDGLMLGRAYHFDLVRPGYALYGGQAFRGERTPVSPVVAVMARVLQVHDVAAGETVGYSATWTAPTPRRIATIAAGYADGVSRHLSATNARPGGEAVVRGHKVPIVGRVSMDLVTLDVTDVPGLPVARGDWAELVGPHITLEDVGRASGSIGYEVLTRLGRRFHRVYRDAPAVAQD